MSGVSGVSVRPIAESDHLAFLDSRRSASFLQTPAWGRVKSEWERESLGWFRDASSLSSSTQGFRDASSVGSSTQGFRDASSVGSSTTAPGDMVGAALVLYRRLPKVKRYLAYLPEGPVLDWDTDDLAALLDPLTAHLKQRGAFGVRIGPPVVTRRWTAQQVKDGIAEESVRRLADLPPAVREPVGAKVVAQLTELGWRPQQVEGGFAAGQPQHVFQVPLSAEGAPRTEDDVLKGMNQQWRRNIKKAAKEGVEVTTLDAAAAPAEDLASALADFHGLYAHTAERDHFTPRPAAYFTTMATALGGEGEGRFRLHLAHHEGDLVAATIAIRVGAHAWYSYGASSTAKRDVRGSNAVQWQMMREALADGADVYDLRGITDTLDPDDPHVGLIQFKVGTGGEAVEYAGEWDLPLNRPLYAAFDLYLRRRGGRG